MSPEGIRTQLDAGNPCRHDEDLHFHPLWESKRMKHFVVDASPQETLEPRFKTPAADETAAQEVV
jgi:hypothetical protein